MSSVRGEAASPAPLVSVVVPYFQRAALLTRALRSVEAQTFRPLEILVVDDASPDDPTALVESLGLSVPARVIRQPSNRGPSAARNVGISAARGDYVAFLDSDDEWRPAKIATQVAAAQAARQPDKAFCIAETVIQWPARREARRCWDPAAERLAEYYFLNGGTMQTSSFLIARPLALVINFDPGLRQFEDLLFVFKALEQDAEFIFQREWLFSWYRDGRGDQLSSAISLSAGFSFLQQASSLTNRRERVAFTTGILGSALAKRRPLLFAAHAVSALWQGVLTPRRLASILYGMRRTKVIA